MVTLQNASTTSLLFSLPVRRSSSNSVASYFSVSSNSLELRIPHFLGRLVRLVTSPLERYDAGRSHSLGIRDDCSARFLSAMVCQDSF